MNRLRELRVESGLLQKEVAKSIGVSTASYGFYENEINKPDPETLIKLADFFEVSIDYLLGRADEYGNICLDMESTFSSEERELIEKYRELNAPGKKLIDTTLNTLLNTSTKNKKNNIG